MALNFTVSYTFSPSTTISSSQVNTNTSDVANVFTGLEAETKTLAKLKVDIDPTLALEVATKQYVDHYSTYRRPVLQYNSGTVVNIETGIDGTSGDCVILFPDGNLRTDTVAGRIQCNLAQVAATSGTAQSGIRTGSVANNTWYAIYAVKTTDNAAHFVAIADTVLPLQANYSTLNVNFGASSWVYLGLVRNGDFSGSPGVILSFTQSGNTTFFTNSCTGNSRNMNGLRMGSTSGATSISWAYAAGTGAQQLPNNVLISVWGCGTGQSGNSFNIQDASGGNYYFNSAGSATSPIGVVARIPISAINGVLAQPGSGSTTIDIQLVGFVDGVLGVGSNPLL